MVLFAIVLTFSIGYVAPFVSGKTNLGISADIWWIGAINTIITGFVSGIFPLILSGIISSDSIAWEFDKGTITSLPSQPATRSEVYLGKYLEKTLVAVLISIAVTASAVISASLSAGGQDYLIWFPIVVLIFSLLLLSIVAISFFIGSVAKSPGLTFGILLGIFLAIVLGTLEAIQYYGFKLFLAFVPFINTDLIMLSFSNYIQAPSGITTLPFISPGKSTQYTIATSTIVPYLVTGTIIDLVIFFFIGYFLFRRSEVKG